jgi:hypothetical protein
LNSFSDFADGTFASKKFHLQSNRPPKFPNILVHRLGLNQKSISLAHFIAVFGGVEAKCQICWLSHPVNQSKSHGQMGTAVRFSSR